MQVLSNRQRVEEEYPVGGDGSDESAAEVGEDSLRCEVAVAERVEHGGVSAEEAAPAHADGGEHGDGVAVNPAVRYEVGYQAERSAHSAERRDGERHEVRVVEAEEPLEHKVDFVGKPRQQLHTLIGGAVAAQHRGLVLLGKIQQNFFKPNFIRPPFSLRSRLPPSLLPRCPPSTPRPLWHTADKPSARSAA